LEKHIGEVIVSVQQGDITEQSTDAIVNAANSDLWMGSGVAGAIKRKGGIQIEEEAMAQGPIKPGEAVVTSSGNLSARFVIHCAGMPPGGSAKYEYVRSSALAALELGAQKKIHSIAFPAIGAGVGGLTSAESAKAIIEAIIEYSKNPKSVKQVVLVGYGESTKTTLEQVLKSMGK
jgi:O-acetyl-ADP-ribose deacetylase (regulator of RNase III)